MRDNILTVNGGNLANSIRMNTSQIGQVQILAIAIFLLLIPTTFIVAQNATLNVSTEGNLILDEPQTDTQPIEQTTVTENITRPPEQNQTEDPSPRETPPEPTEPPTNESNQTEQNETVIIPPENVSVEINVTINTTDSNQTDYNETPINETQFNETIINETANETVNETVEPEEPIIPEINETINETNQTEPEIGEPELHIEISSLDDVLRGEPFPLQATVSNIGTGTARNVVIYWILPDGIEIISGSGSHSCRDLPPEFLCSSEIQAIASLSSLGDYEIKVRVSYSE